MANSQVRSYLTQCIDPMVLESQLPHTAINLLFGLVIDGDKAAMLLLLSGEPTEARAMANSQVHSSSSSSSSSLLLSSRELIDTKDFEP